MQAQVDPHFGLEQDLSQEEPLTLYVDPENVLELQAEDVKNLTAQDLRDLWKVGIRDLYLMSILFCWVCRH